MSSMRWLNRESKLMNKYSLGMLDDRLAGFKRRCSVAVVSAAVAVLAGCAHAPGMQLDVSTPALIKARADFFTIDASTLRQMQEEQEAQAAATAAALAAAKNGVRDYEYRVAAQDVLRVTVWNHPELTNPSGTRDELIGRVVNADGTFFFPYAGRVRAAGRSLQDIRDDVVRGLRRIIRDPQVDVSVMQYRGQRVYLAGEVRTPGSQALTDVPPDLAELVARAGGVTAEADLTNVTITRGKETMKVDLQALYYGGDMRGNVRLQHGDVVNVPERRDAKVFVTGEVLRPVAVPMPRGRLTLADALADAGGVNPLTANARQVFVLRGNDNARSQIYHLNSDSPDAMLLAGKFRLNSRDVIYVDAAPVVRWGRLVANILPSATVAREVLSDTTRAFPR
jgi:polysaccharide biosynthesis/export protein